jgi:hypothetical protein
MWFSAIGACLVEGRRYRRQSVLLAAIIYEGEALRKQAKRKNFEKTGIKPGSSTKAPGL